MILPASEILLYSPFYPSHFGLFIKKVQKLETF
jgi:hypothetical protein